MCVLVDLRYHGKSIHDGELSYQQMSQDIQNIISNLKIKEYDVVGFSDGAIIGLLLAIKDSRLKHLVSIGANTKPEYIKWFFRLNMYIQIFCLLPFCIYNKKARLAFRLNMLMLKEPHIEYEDLTQIHIPVLILAGEYDMIKKCDSQAIKDALPYGILKIIRQGNHFLLRDSFQQTMNEIELFLDACHKEDSYET